MAFNPASLFARDLAAIYADAAALPSGAPNALVFGGVSIPCDAGIPAESLSPAWEGEEGNPSATVIVSAEDLPAGLVQGCRVTYAGKPFRVESVETAPDGLEVSLSLGGLRA